MHKSLHPSAKYTSLIQHTLQDIHTETFATTDNGKLTHTDLLLEEIQKYSSKNVIYYMNNTALQKQNINHLSLCFLPLCNYNQNGPGQISLETHLGKKLSSSHLIHFFPVTVSSCLMICVAIMPGGGFASTLHTDIIKPLREQYLKKGERDSLLGDTVSER